VTGSSRLELERKYEVKMATTKKRKNNPSCANIVSPRSSPTTNIDNAEDDNINSSRKASTVQDKVTQPLLCPITHALMVDPVLAEDGHTYERSSIELWLTNNPTSPLVPNKRLKASNLITLRIVQETVKALVETGAVDDTLTETWKQKTKELDLVKAKDLYDEGSILDAAKLGLPEAQGKVSDWYYFGRNGMEKDFGASLEWARKAAEGGDRVGQFRLACINDTGIQGKLSVDKSQAISWYEKAANQGCINSMNNLSFEMVGSKLYRNYQKAAFWSEKGANKNNIGCLLIIGVLTHEGKGVTKCHKTAREWFEKAVNIMNEIEGTGKEVKEVWLIAAFMLGKMMVRGEGGSEDFIGGITLIEKAASKGLHIAKECLKSIAEGLF